MSPISQIWQQILNLIYPAKCVTCGLSDTHFCQACQDKLKYILPPVCNLCGYPTPAGTDWCRQCQNNAIPDLDGIRSVAFFEDSPLRSAIHHFKYQNQQVLSASFAQLLAECLKLHQLPVDLIIPIPLYKSRYKQRGYNQSALLARSLSQLIDLPLDTKSLTRQRSTATQASLSAAERHINVVGAFSCTPEKINVQSILLIDDVCTTGATLNACAQVLKNAGARSVYGLTLARAK